jgi:fumarate reductase subunit D
MIKSIYLHGIIFNICWLFAIPLQMPLISVVVFLLWSFFITTKAEEWFYIAIVALLGLTVDSFFVKIQWLNFESELLLNILPFWLLAVWLAFAKFSYHWFENIKLSVPVYVVLFAILGPVNYFAGGSITSSEINWQQYHFTSMFVIWWSLLPLFCLYIKHKIDVRLRNNHTDALL